MNYTPPPVRADLADLVTLKAKYDWLAIAKRALYHANAGSDYRAAYREALLQARRHMRERLRMIAARAEETPRQAREREAQYIDCPATYRRAMASAAEARA